jgi:mono/diheme cytochrome c family protein
MSKARTHHSLIAAVAVLALVVSSCAAFAANVDRGKQLASRLCSVCHALAVGQSPGVPNAPSFRSIARSPQFRAKRAKLLWEKHGAMPNFALTSDEADDVAAYIRSLAR